MHNPVLVQVPHRPGNLRHPAGRRVRLNPIPLNRLPPQALRGGQQQDRVVGLRGPGTEVIGLGLEMFGEAAAGDIVHGDVVLPVELTDLVDPHDARVPQAGRGTRLAVKPRHVRLGSHSTWCDQLQCHHAVQVRLAGQVDHPHRAPANSLGQLVSTKPGTHPVPGCCGGCGGCGGSCLADRGRRSLCRPRHLCRRHQGVQPGQAVDVLAQLRASLQQLAAGRLVVGLQGVDQVIQRVDELPLRRRLDRLGFLRHSRHPANALSVSSGPAARASGRPAASGPSARPPR